MTDKTSPIFQEYNQWESPYKLYKLHYLDHNTFIFLKLSQCEKRFLRLIFSKSEINYEFNELPYYENMDILTNVLEIFNNTYPSNNFNTIYSALIDYSVLKKDIMIKSVKLNSSEYTMYHKNDSMMSQIECDALYDVHRDIISTRMMTEHPSYKIYTDNTNINDVIASFNEDELVYNHQELVKNTTTFCIYYCGALDFSICLDKELYWNIIESIDLKETSNIYLALKLVLVKEITVENQHIPYTTDMLSISYVESINMLSDRIALFENNLSMMEKISIDTEYIKHYLAKFFEMTGLKTDRIQSLSLLSEIADGLHMNIDSFGNRNNIVKELLKLGLKHTPTPSGNFFYGIKHTDFTNSSPIGVDNNVNVKLEKLIKGRKEIMDLYHY